jgi:RNA polymerase sigma-70 factor (ECF subfamily)
MRRDQQKGRPTMVPQHAAAMPLSTAPLRPGCAHPSLARAAAPRAAGPSLESLMAAAQAGDALAYDRLLRRALPLLRGIARRRMPNVAEAEDAVQDTLLTLHRLRHTYDPARPFAAWLATLCERRCVDRLRQARRGAQCGLSTDDLAEVLCDAGAEEGGPARVAAGELHAAIGALPRGQAMAIRMMKLQGMSLAEASAACGRAPSALKMATHRAMQALRARLGAVE